jgi:hypothetical protein
MKFHTEPLCLLAHARQQLPAAYAIRESGMIVGAANEACAASTGVDYGRAQAETSQVDCGSKPGRASPDDEAIRSHVRNLYPARNEAQTTSFRWPRREEPLAIRFLHICESVPLA